jgi:hypothetical protein
LVEQIRAACTVFGIDEDTAVLLDEGHGRVAGRGGARVFEGTSERAYASGERFTL